MRAVTKRMCERIYSISVYDYKAYIDFVLILLSCMAGHVITQIMSNGLGYVKGSTEFTIVSLVLALIKMALGFNLLKAISNHPEKKRCRITLLICQIEVENPRLLLIPVVAVMETSFVVVALYNVAYYFVMNFAMK